MILSRATALKVLPTQNAFSPANAHSSLMTTHTDVTSRHDESLLPEILQILGRIWIGAMCFTFNA